MISYGRQSIDESDINEVILALKSDWLTIGPRVEEFESALEVFTGAPTISVSSGTAALHCAFAAIDLKPGDEVITPPITFIATQATAALFGAKIVFADVQIDTANIDPRAAEAAITSKTKAIVAVDFAGHPAELGELKKITSKNGIYLIEDAAHSLGAKYKGQNVGSIADLTTFSFFPTKNITTGEGGAVASMHSDLLKKAKRFARQGIVREREEFKLVNEGNWHQEVHNFGLNYRLPDVLCALGLSQLKRLNKFQEDRNQIFKNYHDKLHSYSEITLPITQDHVEPFWHLYPIRVPSNMRRSLYDFLHTNGIKVQVNYLPAHLHPVFENCGYKKGDFPVSENFYESEISLPIYSGLQEEDLMKIIGCIEDFFLKNIN